MRRKLLSGLLGGVLALTPVLVRAGEPQGTPSAEERSQEKLETDLGRKLNSDERLQGSHIKVDVMKQGEVRLAGRVPSEAARKRAVELAEKTKGVSKVDDHLRVEIPN
jgi:osmotically-inducible protein OsmY